MKEKKINKPIDCSCHKITANEDNNLLEQFIHVRNECPALKEILVPEDTWQEFLKTAKQEMDEALHQHILLLSFKYGLLQKITSPVHRYLIENNKPKEQLTKQYKKDLRERWMFKKNVLERHQKARIYAGKLEELHCAEWIEEMGWKINNLEALGGSYDIEATSPHNTDCAIEVKYIGMEDNHFLSAVESLSDNYKSHSSSPYVACDFILYKSYTAAKQLQKSTKTRIVFLIIDGATWPLVEKDLKEGWIDWHAPKFFNKENSDWIYFIEKEKKRFPDIENNLSTALKSLHELWIIKQENQFQYSLEIKIMNKQ